MNKKKFSFAIFLFIFFCISYFVYSVFRADAEIDESVQNQTQIFDQLQKIGVTDFQAKTINNADFKFSSLKNKFVILNFWASWCGPCVEEFPSLIKLIQEKKGEVALVALSLDQDEKQMSDFLKNYDIANSDIHILRDPDYYLAENFGTYKLPESYILGPDRKLMKKVTGSIDWNSNDIKSFLK